MFPLPTHHPTTYPFLLTITKRSPYIFREVIFYLTRRASCLVRLMSCDTDNARIVLPFDDTTLRNSSSSEMKGIIMKKIFGWLHDPGRPPVQLGLAIVGLLCHLLVFLSLSFPYVYTYDPYYQVSSSSDPGFTFIDTGWQLVTAGPIAIVLLPLLILPIFPYLGRILFILLKSERMNSLLEQGFAGNVLLNVLGFLFFYVILSLSQVGDFDKQTHQRDAAYGIHLALIFFFVVCSSASSVLLRYSLRQSRAKLHSVL